MAAVRRPRLSDRVAALSPRLVMLIAPAGFGKSSLVREILAAFKRHEIVDCSLSDNPAALARRMTLALAALADRTEQVAREQASTIADDAEAIALTERLWLELDFAGALVLENAETVLNDPECVDLLRRLMRSPGEQRTIVICSRVRPPAGITGRLGPQEIVIYSEDDLRFTKAETNTLLESMSLSAQQLHRLHSVSRGWAIALRLFEHVAYERDVDQAIDALELLDTETLQAYVIEQIIPTLDRDAYEALLFCSAIPGASRVDLAVHFGARNGPILSALLDPVRVPFVSFGTDDTFEPHPLIRSALRAREPEAIRTILRATAIRHERAGDRVRAAQLFLHAGDQMAAAAALGPVEAFLVGAVRPAVGLLLSAFDKSTLIEFPALWQAAINYRALRIDPDEWLAEAQHIWDRLTEETSTATWCGVAMNLGNCHHNRGRHDAEALVLGELESRFRDDPFVVLSLKLARLWCDINTAKIQSISAPMADIAPFLDVPYVKANFEYDAVAPFERFVRGDLVADRQTLIHAIEVARGLETRVLLVLALMEAAFSAWFAGDDSLFESFCNEVKTATDSSVEGGTRHFLDSISGRGAEARVGSEKLNARAYAQLIAAARARSATESRRLAAAAIATADESRQPAYQVLSRIALAIVEPDIAVRLFSEAVAILGKCHLPALADAVGSLTRNESGVGILSEFVKRFERVARTTDVVEVCLLDGRVYRGGLPIALRPRLLELLFLIASEPRAFAASELTDALWAESDADRATNALRVAVNRLRRSLGTGTILSNPGGYQLGRNVSVDAFVVQEVIGFNDSAKSLSEEHRKRLQTAFSATSPSRVTHFLSSSMPASLRRLFIDIHYGSGILLARDAIARRNYRVASDFAREITDYAPLDETARRHLVESMLGLGNEVAARAEWAAYEAACRANPISPYPVSFDEVLADFINAASKIDL